MANSINLLDVAKYFNGQPHQVDALNKLKAQLPSNTIWQFARAYRNNNNGADISLVDAFKYYKGLDFQVKAFTLLQSLIDPKVLENFATDWRAKPSVVQLITKKQVDYIFDKTVSDYNYNNLINCLNVFSINTNLRMKHFLTQIGHESAGLTYLKEIGSNEYFSRMYDWREDLGNNQLGDGARFPGLGPLQCTGRRNFQAFANYMNDQNIMKGTDYCIKQGLEFNASGHWWSILNTMNPKVDRGETVYQISGRVNTGSPYGKANGMSDRLWYWTRAGESLGV